MIKCSVLIRWVLTTLVLLCLSLDVIQTDCSTAAKKKKKKKVTPDVTHCSMLYHPLFGTGNILKYFLINHVPAIGFAPRLCRLIPDSCHDSWHGHRERKKKKRCPSFSLVSITLVRGWGEVKRRRRKSRRQDLTPDILPRLVRVTGRSETRRCSGQACTRAERWRVDGGGRVGAACLRHIKSTSL